MFAPPRDPFVLASQANLLHSAEYSNEENNDYIDLMHDIYLPIGDPRAPFPPDIPPSFIDENAPESGNVSHFQDGAVQPAAGRMYEESSLSIASLQDQALVADKDISTHLTTSAVDSDFAALLSLANGLIAKSQKSINFNTPPEALPCETDDATSPTIFNGETPKSFPSNEAVEIDTRMTLLTDVDLLHVYRHLDNKLLRGFDQRAFCYHPAHERDGVIHMLGSGESAMQWQSSSRVRFVSMTCLSRGVSLSEAEEFAQEFAAPMSGIHDDGQGGHIVSIEGATCVRMGKHKPKCFGIMEGYCGTPPTHPGDDLCWIYTNGEQNLLMSRSAMRKSSGVEDDSDLVRAANPGSHVLSTWQLPPPSSGQYKSPYPAL